MAGLNLFTNNAATTLASGINNTDVSLTVATGTGALFPNPTAGQYFYCTLANNAGTVEIVKVTARSTDTFTIVRGQDGTTAVSWNTGDKVELRLVRASLNNFGQLDSTNTWDLAQTFTAAPTFSQAPVLSSLTASKPVFTDASKNLTSSGTLGIDQGGTGQTTKTAAFDALAPTTTNGDMMYFNGTDVVRLGIGSSGQALVVSGGVPAWGNISSYEGFNTVQFFTSGSTSWTVPTGITRCVVTVVGGGGGGGGFGPTSYNWPGGGGYAKAYITGLTPGASITVTVGGGGSGNNNTSAAGGTGGTSSFGSYVSATGGTGSAAGAAGTPGTGTVSIGTTIKTRWIVSPSTTGGVGIYELGQQATRDQGAGTAGVDWSTSGNWMPGSGGAGESGSSSNNASGGVGGIVIIQY